MADRITYPGRLIAIDGSRGKDVTAAADALAAALRERNIDCAVSRWDASGLFGELAGGMGDRTVSIRTLSLVYAADLAFRLRWEIRPILEAGGIVIAAPYVDTATALGATCGIDEAWLRQLLRYAPPASWQARAEERKIGKPWKHRLDRGYAEYAAALLEQSRPGCVSKSARRKMIARLEHARHRPVFTLSGTGAAALVRAVTGSRRDASSRPSSQPRSARS